MIIFLSTLISFSAFACRPGPLPECTNAMSKVDAKNLYSLEASATDYQNFLTTNLVPPKKRSSCFDNHFGTFYLGQLMNAEKFCTVQVASVKAHLMRLIDEKSPENKAVPAKFQSELKQKAKILREKLQALK